MTTAMDLDRLLVEVLDADGPRTAPPRVVEAAIQEASTVRQRTPLPAPLDRGAWPRPWFGPVLSRRLAVLALVGLLVVTLAAALLGIGARRSFLGDASRVSIWVDGVLHVLTPAGTVASIPVIDRGFSCGIVVGGADMVATSGFGALVLRDIETQREVGEVGTDYAGSEVWSADHRHLALVDLAGRVGIAGLSGAPSAATRWVAVPDIRSVVWDGMGMLVLGRRVGEALVIERLDPATLSRTTRATLRIDWPDDETYPSMSVAPDGRWLLLRGPFDAQQERIVDLATGQATIVSSPSVMLAVTWSPDSTLVALGGLDGSVWLVDPTGAVVGRTPPWERLDDLAWAPDGQHLAVLAEDRLRLTDRTGREIRTISLEPRSAVAWADPNALFVARPEARGAVAIERRRASDLGVEETRRSSIALPSPPPYSYEEVCLQVDGPFAHRSQP